MAILFGKKKFATWAAMPGISYHVTRAKVAKPSLHAEWHTDKVSFKKINFNKLDKNKNITNY